MMQDDNLFDLTDRQVELYLDYCASINKPVPMPAGIAEDNHRCPLAMAYRFHHPGEPVDVGYAHVVLGRTALNLKSWQKLFVFLVDKLSPYDPFDEADQDYPISVEQAREVLKKATEKEGADA